MTQEENFLLEKKDNERYNNKSRRSFCVVVQYKQAVRLYHFTTIVPIGSIYLRPSSHPSFLHQSTLQQQYHYAQYHYAQYTHSIA